MWKVTLKDGQVYTESEAKRQGIRFSDLKKKGIVKIEIIDTNGKTIAEVEDSEGKIFYQKCAAVSFDGRHFFVGEEIGKVTDPEKYECLIITVENNQVNSKREIKGKQFFEIHGLL